MQAAQLTAVLALGICLVVMAALGDRTADQIHILGTSADPLQGTVPPSNWKWTSCYGQLPSNTTYSFVGSYEEFGVVASSQNEVFVVDLRNGTTWKSERLSSPQTSNLTYYVLSNGMLLQLGATMAAWSLPDLRPMWSVETASEIGGPIAVLSTTGNFFCIYLVQVSNSTNWNSMYPSCFRVSDGSLVWGNSSLTTQRGTLYESQGVLLLLQYMGETLSNFLAAIHVETGTYLWTPLPQVVMFLVYDDLAVLNSPTWPNTLGVSAVNIHTGQVVWNQSSLRDFATLVTATGVAIGQEGVAYWVQNGSCVWNNTNFPWSPIALISQPKSGSATEATFLYGVSYSDGFNYTIGEVMTGQTSPTTAIITPSGSQLVSSELGYYFFAIHPLGSVGSSYCLHAFPSNE